MCQRPGSGRVYLEQGRLKIELYIPNLLQRQPSINHQVPLSDSKLMSDRVAPLALRAAAARAAAALELEGRERQRRRRLQPRGLAARS